jgi:hypothetical protein
LVNESDARQVAAREATAAEAFQLRTPVRTRERRRVKRAATLVALVLAVLGFASYKFVANAGRTQHATVAAHTRGRLRTVPVGAPSVLPSPASVSTAPASSAPASSAPASSAPASSAPASSAPAVTASPTATTPPPPRVLTVASVAAFGPGGLADGQNSENAARALSGNPATPWLSDWYASPDFFDLPNGTGLLLDLGRTVTVTSVQVSLNGYGANLQLRAGGEPTPGWLPEVASAANAGGTVRLRPNAPAHVRYVLIWFTQLPPDASGTYQASVYRVLVQGQP